jgi:hypothetical protein
LVAGGTSQAEGVAAEGIEIALRFSEEVFGFDGDEGVTDL